MIRMFAATAFVCLASGLYAEEAPTPPQIIEQKAVQAFGEDNKTCASWTDDCIVCRRADSATPLCSLPGIACVPKAVVCQTMVEAPMPAAPQPPSEPKP